MKTNEYTVIIPTYNNRYKYLNRILDYLSSYKLNILVVDSSLDPFPDRDNYDVEYLHLPKYSYTMKLYLALKKIVTPFALMCADDDYVIPSSIDKCVSFLNTNDDYASVQGNIVAFKNKIFIPSFPWMINTYALDIDKHLPTERIHEFFNHHMYLHYSVHRKGNLIATFELMKNFENEFVKVIKDGEELEFSIGSPEAFKIISDVWLRSGWDAKYVYSFAWMGRPIIQLPEDMVRTQEVIYNIQPDVIIETGIAHGGSLIYYASLCKAMEKGKIVGIDIEIRPHNRKAIEEHLLFPYITLIEGSSIDEKIVKEASNHISVDDTVMVLLDSNHTYDHVLAELRAYSKLVTVGSYIVATDGIMENVVGAPRTNPDWDTNNPKKALEQFVKENDSFIIDEPVFPFNEGVITERVTYWPSAFIKRIK